MPVVACPKCPTQLKIPDGANGNVKCPKCGNIFPVIAPKPAAFEIVDGTPVSKPGSLAPKTPSGGGSGGFEVLGAKPRKRTTRDWDDEDEDEDDRPRSKRKSRRDYGDDDDEDDRPRKKKRTRRYDDDDDYDDWRPPKRKSNGYGPAKTGALLLSTGAWLYMGAFGLLAMLVLLGWSAGASPGGIVVIAGLVGLSNWVVSLVGLGFCVAGPERARGPAVAALVVSAIHLVLSFVCFDNRNDVFAGPGGGGAAWGALATQLGALNGALPILLYHSQAFSGSFLVSFVAGGCEVARLILIIITLRNLAQAARAGGTADRAGTAILTVVGVCCGVALAALLISVLIAETGMLRAGLHLAAAVSLLSHLGYAFMAMAPALLAKETRDALAARA